MKTSPPNPKIMTLPRGVMLTALAAFVLLSTTAVFGQTNFIWIGPNGGDLAGPTNWSPTGVPSPTDTALGGLGDLMIWNGSTAGPLALTSNTGSQTGFSGSAWGLNVYLTSTQTSPVTWYTTLGTSSGIRVNNFTNDPGSGSLILGDNTGNAIDTVWGGVANQIHELLNNSASGNIINPNLRLRYGGGGAHNLVFDGTGNWYVTNSLITANGSPTVVTKQGTGTMYWFSTNVPNDAINSTIQSPETISAGTLVLLNSAIFSASVLGPRTIANNSLLVYSDVNPNGAGTLSGVISGTGNIQVTSGTLTLAGANTYTGSNILNGGEIIAASAETAGTSGPLGVGGTNTFAGGTLGFSVVNVFDYSPRFDTANNQQYSFDTQGQNVTFATGLASVGGTLTKIGPGTLTLSGTSSYTGQTTVRGGKLVFQGSVIGTGNITVDDGAALGVTATGSPVAPATLTVGSTSGATLEFNDVSSTSTAPLAPSTLAAAGTIIVNVNSGTFAVSQTYPLFSWTSSTSGGAPAVTLGILNGFIGNLVTNGNSIAVHIIATAYSWTGANNNVWDLTTANNWDQNGGPVVFANGGPAIFGDTSTQTNVAIQALVSPSLLTYNNNTNAYTFATSASGNITGNANILMAGSGTVTVSGGANTYTGVTTLTGGTLSVSTLANGGSASDLGAASNNGTNLVLNGGTLQYTGAAVFVDRLFTLTTSGGTIDSSGTGALQLNNTGSLTYSGNSARTLILTGTETDSNTLSAAIGDNGGSTAVTKNNTGTWILNGNNTYSGLTTIANGELQVGTGGSTGSLGNSSGTILNGTLDFNRTGVLTVNGAISGTGSLTNDNTGTNIIAGNNSYIGGTTINSGALQIGNGGASGQLYSASPVVDNGLLIFNSTGTCTLEGNNAIISGTGNIIARGGGKFIAEGGNTYTGWTEIDTNTTFQPITGNEGALVSLAVTNNGGTLLLVRQDFGVFSYPGLITGTGKLIKDVNNFNPGDVTLLGTNEYTGGTIIGGGPLIIGNGATIGSIVGNVLFTNSTQVGNDDYRALVFVRSDNIDFPGNITGTPVGGAQANAGQVVQLGTGILQLDGANNYTGGTAVSNGTIVVAGSGTIGTGPVTDLGSLIFSNSSTTLAVPGAFTGTGTVAMEGSGMVTLTGANTNLTGSMTAISGTLTVVGAEGGEVDVSGGTLAAGGFKSVGTLTLVGSNLNINSGFVSMSLNKALAQSNSFVQMATATIINTNVAPPTTNFATGTITYTGGTLQLINIGPTPAIGDRFVLFSQPVTGGAAMPIVSAGLTFANNLAVDGSVTVTAVGQPPRPTISQVLFSGPNIVITATNNFGPGGSWTLVATNNLRAPVNTWPVVGNGNFNANGNAAITNAIGSGSLFFDLRAP